MTVDFHSHTLESDGTLSPARSEDDIYSALGLPCIPAEIRNGVEEIELASRGALPTLVSRAEIRGDLHMHSMYSDGRDPIEAMVEGCRALGYEYLAITDHSASFGFGDEVSPDRLREQTGGL